MDISVPMLYRFDGEPVNIVTGGQAMFHQTSWGKRCYLVFWKFIASARLVRLRVVEKRVVLYEQSLQVYNMYYIVFGFDFRGTRLRPLVDFDWFSPRRDTLNRLGKSTGCTLYHGKCFYPGGHVTIVHGTPLDYSFQDIQELDGTLVWNGSFWIWKQIHEWLLRANTNTIKTNHWNVRSSL